MRQGGSLAAWHWPRPTLTALPGVAPVAELGEGGIERWIVYPTTRSPQAGDRSV
jgi:hypothetical protein